ncbi:MAG: MraY family glycosyltransferase, partial [Desulfatiglandales bacterium]
SDGLDGLAGGIALLSFIFIGYLAYRVENVPVFLFSVAVIGAIFGFLRYNTYPATLFMGDTGSQFLGFLAVTLSVSLTQENRPYSPVLPLLLLGMPVLDTAVVMVTRMARGKSPFVADMNHFHHKLMRMGLYHTEAVFVIYMLQAFLVVCAFLFRYYSEWFLLNLYVVVSLLIVGGCHVALRAGWTLERPGPYDRMIKMPLRALKDKQIAIKASGRVMGVLLPVLLLFSCVVPGAVPAYFSWGALGCGAVLCLVWFLKRPWAPVTLRLLLYLFIPFVVFFSELDEGGWMGERLSLIYDLSFAVMVFFVIITLKFTRRQRGFKTSPMDFLIIFIALIVPNLPDPGIKHYHMGMVAAKMIVLYFSYEVLIGELRGKVGRLVLWTLAALLVAGGRMVI